MEPIKFANFAEMKRQLAKQGIKPFTPEEKAAYDRKVAQKTIASWQDYQRKMWHKKENLWSGDIPLEFTFKPKDEQAKNYWDPTKQKNEQLARDLGNKAYALANKMIDSNFNVLMIGQPGTGKTSLALAIADYLEKHDDRKFIFISTDSLGDLFNETYNGGYEDSANAKRRLNRLVDKAREARLLILDDFGTEAGTGNARNGQTFVRTARNDVQSWIYRLADARYSEHAGSTIVTTNYSTGDLMKMYSRKLISRLITKKPENTMNFKGMEDVRE